MKDRKKRKAAGLPWKAKKAAEKSAEKRKESEETFSGEALRDEDLEGVAGGIGFVSQLSAKLDLRTPGKPN